MKKHFARPVVFASRCLGFDACRWNGVAISAPLIDKMKAHVDFITHCPEMEIGLGVPRKPVRIIRHEGEKHLYQPETDRFFTKEMTQYSKRAVADLPRVHGFILKTRSPSCGPRDVKFYDGKQGKSSIEPIAGIFAREIIDRHGLTAVEDEGRLTNFTIRERFFIKIFALADFHRAADSGKIKSLLDFHQRSKLTLMACNQKEQKALGKLLAAQKTMSFAELCGEYEKGLGRAFRTGPRPGTSINVMMHAMGYFKKSLKSAEKALLLDLMESYRDKKTPLSAPAAVIKSWIERFDEPYLRTQTFFDPYPQDLVSISDSGKGADY